MIKIKKYNKINSKNNQSLSHNTHNNTKPISSPQIITPTNNKQLKTTIITSNNNNYTTYNNTNNITNRIY